MRFRSDIQGLRAIAVIPVILFHFGLTFVSGGFTGVDVFFCISGYVIAGSVINDLQNDRFSIADFYFKRVRRIFPALGVVLLATTISAIALLLPDDLSVFGHSLIATSTFWSNIYFWHLSGYFAPSAQIQPLLHTWSLSIEEQFYLFVPFLLSLIFRFGHQRWWMFVGPAMVASMAVSIGSAFYAPTAGFFLLPSRAWELLVGVLIALYPRGDLINKVARETIAALGFGLIAAGLFWINETDPFPGWCAILPVGGTAMVIVAGHRADDRLPLINRILSLGPVVWIGDLSYSLYLVHWPVAAFVRYTTLSAPTALQAVVMFVASLLISLLLRQYVENPLRKVSRAQLRLVLGCGLLMMGASAAVSAILFTTGGLPNRYPGFVDQHIDRTAEWKAGKCFNVDKKTLLPWDKSECTRIRGKHGTMLLWGDSFAAHYVPGILRDSRRIDADVLQYTFAGCPPILAYRSLSSAICTSFNQSALKIIADEHVDTVILSARWSETPRRTIEKLHETVNLLRLKGIRVFVIGQSPEFVADVQRIDLILERQHSAKLARWPVSFPSDFNALIKLQSTGANFIDPLKQLCDQSTCPYRNGKTYLYLDYGHFSQQGSAIAVKRYFPTGQQLSEN